LLVAIVSQVVVIVGLVAWGYWLGSNATGSLPAAPTAVISLSVSDPRWHVAPTLDVAQHTWTVGLSSQGGSFGAADPSAQAVLVLWGAARLTDPHPIHRPLSAAEPGSYRQIQVKSSDATAYTHLFFAGSEVPVQVFVVMARNIYTSRSVLPIIGTVSPGLYAETPTGWTAYVPPIGYPSVEGFCKATPHALPAAITGALQTGQRSWYDTTCPTQAPSVQLTLGGNENLNSSSLPPASQGFNGNYPLWTNQANSIVRGFLPGFWIDVSDPAIAAAAQRDLLFAGVLYGIAGGLMASWLVAGITFVVTKAVQAGQRSTPTMEATGKTPSAKSQQIAPSRPGVRADQSPASPPSKEGRGDGRDPPALGEIASDNPSDDQAL
jgi:hypothetical protein